MHHKSHLFETYLSPWCSHLHKISCFWRKEWESRKSHRRELFESKLKAFCVVCNPFSCDVLHSVLQHLLVPHIGLNQMIETRCLLHPGVELGSRDKVL